ncbi:formate dehydrogenase accessory sulfurtransferase FdhD [Pseudomonas sp. C27(2019)]|uniref:formate dehydrogenase accessory sulfurtransferase FdhD n=1 Tax=Pseudomonas sp. C27(2019) TaxID=2604941 RepID=UPI0012475D6A|nr:formate dehydrogenase accessory sulfurtransferase FdhD [Pseudomonas sp. C27(2019)]QEY58889.1 formate dehydrogenase accessory sulfurtransferase FdhD [Pseudomonas sp. C27(2019)]
MPNRLSKADMSAVIRVSDDSVLPSPVSELRVDVRGGIEGAAAIEWDTVAQEIPIAMVYNGVTHAVMMASPGDLEDFALGFSLTEGILQRSAQLFSFEIIVSDDGIAIDMHIAGDCFTRLQQQRRSMVGRTGCGLCGTESLAQVVRSIAPVAAQRMPADEVVQRALCNLSKHQPQQLQTGATHGAAWCSANGQVLMVREDVGRHNALDKLIGARIREYGEQAFSHGFALITSRASFEMVQKSASVGIGSLVAVSAPTALAIREACKSGMNLIGFARPGRHVIYAQSGECCEEKQL